MPRIKWIIRLIVGLYPARWRHRYRTEFEALLEDITSEWRDLFDVIKGALEMQAAVATFGKSLAAFGMAGALLAASLSFTLRDRYLSVGLVTITQAAGVHRAELTELVRRALDRDSLAGVIEKEHLYERERLDMSREEVIDRMRRDIRIVLASPKALEVSFEYTDAARAQRTSADLLERLISENLNLPTTNALLVQDRPSMPQGPFWPNRTVVTSFGLVAGLLMGAVVAWVRRPRSNEQI
jgi:hypothetical protein